MFYRLKPKIIQTNTMTIFPNDEYEQVRLKDCVKSIEKSEQCPSWNNGKGSQECCGCRCAEWEAIADIERCSSE